MKQHTEPIDDMFAQIRQQGHEFRMEPPPHAWPLIESKLENSHSIRRISFYRYLYRVAIVVFLFGVTILSYQYISHRNVSNLDEAQLYANNIEALSSGGNVYPVYNVHKLTQAYKKLARPVSEAPDNPPHAIIN